MQKRVLVLVGPTASGKTPVSLLLATLLDGEIISADSRQVYQFMNIGTAKPELADLRQIKHYFIDVINPNEDFSAGEYGGKGREIIADSLSRGKTPIVVGGSGLYVKALVDGLFEGPAADPEFRKDVYNRLRRDGKESLYAELRRLDHVSAVKMTAGNTRRVIRALEVYHLTGVPISQHHELQQRKADFQAIFFGLKWDRKKLYGRIDRRVDWMMSRGLVEEVVELRKKGYDESLNALQTVGYVEVFDYLAGRITKEEMVDQIKRNSRRYAKRQLTWFRKDQRILWIHVEGESELPAVAEKILHNFVGGHEVK